MPELDIVEIEITKPLPGEGAIDITYQIEGSVKIDTVGAPPWVYAEVQKKEWYKPEIVEETSYERGFPIPISGDFSIEWKPKKPGIYEVTVVATPAPLPLPAIGLPPITGRSDMMKITVAEKPAGEYSNLKITKYEKVIA